MAAVIAPEKGLSAARSLSRPDLAKHLATREPDRLLKSAPKTHKMRQVTTR